MYRYSIETRLLENNNEMILGNRRNGEWIKTTKEIIEFIDEYLQCSVEETNDFFNSFSKEDEQYLRQVIELLGKNEIIVSKDDTRDYQADINEVLITVTSRCNLTCNHCSMNATSSKGVDKLSYEDIVLIINQLAELKVHKLIITGGEPMIRKDFFEIIKYVKENTELNLGVMTNATLINKNNVDFLVEYTDTIDISIDGVDESTCSVIRGNGVFNRVISAVKLLKERQYEHISLSMVNTPNNAPFMKQFYSLCKEIGVTPAVRKFELIGRAAANKEILTQVYPTPKVQKEEVKNINSPTGVQISKNSNSRIKMSRCGALRRSFSINEKGAILPCSLLEKEEDLLGTIYETNLLSLFGNKDITQLDSFRKLSEFDVLKDEECAKCNVRYFCQTCPHITELISEGVEVKNSICAGRKEYLKEIVWGSNY